MKKLLLAIPVLFLLPLASFAANPEKATIVTQNKKPSECISSVAIRKIDGKNKFVSPQGFELSPGMHSMSGTVALNVSNCPVVRGNTTNFTTIAPLEADFEAGKTYFVGFDHSATDRAEWALVIWKVE